MINEFEKILDNCIDRINRGESIDSCLTDYPDYAEQLSPLLKAMFNVKEAYSFVPSSVKKRANKQLFYTALENQQRKREEKNLWFAWLHNPSRLWTTAVAIFVIAVISYFGITRLFIPGESVDQPSPGYVTPDIQPSPGYVAPDIQPSPTFLVVSPQPSPEGNFAFLISDDVNAIGDFDSVMVTISKIGLQLGGEAGKWIEFNPEVEKVDLTLLPGDKAQVVWRGNVPEGKYTKVFIHVTGVQGVVKETKQTVEVELPSQKLQISKAFDVSADTVTSFVYDITVVEAGKSGKYILKPQVGQSGADQRFEEIDGKN